MYWTISCGIFFFFLAFSLDELLDGGLYTGELTEIVGAAGVGKSQVKHKIDLRVDCVEPLVSVNFHTLHIIILSNISGFLSLSNFKIDQNYKVSYNNAS